MPADAAASGALNLDAALDPALIAMESGGATSVADRALENMLKGFGVTGASVVWRLDHVTLSVARGGEVETRIGTIGPVGLSLKRASAAIVVAEEFARGNVAPQMLAEHVARIRKIAPPSRWALAPCAALAGGALTQTMDGDVGAFGIAALAGGMGQFTRSLLPGWGLTRAATTLLCTLVSALIALGALRLGFSQTPPAALAGAVIYAVPGLLLINAYLDLISERFLFVGLQRLVHATFLSLLITLAVLIADAVIP
jgi:uncharacterized membrane protein YjjP (DUF1212 family)